MSLHWVDQLSLAAYLAIIIAMGVYFARKNTSTEEYFLGGRRFSGWVVGLSLVGTSISSITFLAYPADAYKTGWLRFLPNLMLPIAIVIAAFYFLPIFRRHNLTTAYQYLEMRFGPSVRVYGACAFMLAQLVRIATILYLLSLLIHETTGLETLWCIILGGLFVAVYTVIGGIDAVIWTDVMQTVILVLGGILCLWVIVDALPGGLQQIFSVATEHQKFAIAEFKDGAPTAMRWDLSLLNKTGTMMLILGLTNWLTEYSANQNVVQRYFAVKNEQEARKAMWICAGTSLPIWAFYMFLGTALFVFFQQFPNTEAAAMLDGSAKAEQILPYFIINELPKGVIGIVIAAALAAAMSSLDSSINAISTVFVTDIYKRHLKPDQPDAHYLSRAKLTAALSSVFMVLGAIYIATTETKTLQDLATILVSLLGGGLLGLFLFGFFTKIGDARSAWAGIIATMVFTGWTLLAKQGAIPNAISVPFDLYYTGMIGNIIMFGVIFVFASFLGRSVIRKDV